MKVLRVCLKIILNRKLNILLIKHTNQTLMYLRYLAKYYDDNAEKIDYGFFKALEYLRDHYDLSIEDRKIVEEYIYWFDHNLPIPDYYQDERNRQAAKAATSWFKDTSTLYIKRMNELFNILKRYNIEVDRISSKKLTGKKIYEDEFQVTIIPYRNNLKKTK